MLENETFFDGFLFSPGVDGGSTTDWYCPTDRRRPSSPTYDRRTSGVEDCRRRVATVASSWSPAGVSRMSCDGFSRAVVVVPSDVVGEVRWVSVVEKPSRLIEFLQNSDAYRCVFL